MSFTCFQDLPLELRQQIWLNTIKPAEPEIYMVTQKALIANCIAQNGTQYLAPVVDTGFPVALFVCRESRAVITSLAKDRVWFRWSDETQCLVSVRLFRKDFDTLYSREDNVPPMELGLVDNTHPEALKSLAIDLSWGFRFDTNWSKAWMDQLSKVETLSIVLADSSCDSEDGTLRPFRRSKLLPISPEMQKTIVIKPHHLMDTRSRFSWSPRIGFETYTVPLDKALEHCRTNLMTHHFNTLLLEWRPEQGPRPTRLTQETLDAYKRLRIEPKILVEYQPDGTWKQICSDGTFWEFRHLDRDHA